MYKIYLLFSILFIFSCSVKQEKINYGDDACSFCKMNIVDETHSAEIVTKKGKAYKYDAIECMINDLKNKNLEKIALFLVADYDIPKKLIDATKAIYLIDKKIKSPMGANLSAFSKKSNAEKHIEDSEGNIYSWQEIQIHFKK